MSAYKTDIYNNVFKEYGYSEEEIENKLEYIYKTIFFGNEDERLYNPVGDDMACFIDTGNNDVRTEGMSYAMMMCVQRNMKEEFDKLWKWAKTYMYMEDGWNKGYFAWSVKPNGEKNSNGPASDGEEYFALALFFAANRWRNGEGIFNYSKEARKLLYECVHKGEKEQGDPMWDPKNKLIKFVPGLKFTDPSYHLPHFYELFSIWSMEEDHEFWKEAAHCSREFLKKACDPVTGLAAEYSHYDGSPYVKDKHERYYSDSYRVPANLGLSYEWFENSKWECECSDKIQTFFCEAVKGKADLVYEIDGTIIEEKALHPVAIIATNAMASLASKGKYRKKCVDLFWNTPLRTGERRYYDNCLYVFAFLALSGNYKIWK
ncbi:reducing end xylose-releasing exo-oligoxylanase [Clostridium puniceum]|uniref:Reducing end xylose-releasing exo-oligoxylanase n=1 Tax=Clostridium puniceum TaxID=29367 RepID=A0A1S8TMC4_9CLOT|nr:glycosyl hydrolase family 8 [Clostridium puniceum]OOM78779.1 reducing end xylose-releasing exo-oligoxylanase [Clostridium puniceum]